MWRRPFQWKERFSSQGTYIHTYIRTSRLYDWIGPVGQFSENGWVEEKNFTSPPLCLKVTSNMSKTEESWSLPKKIHFLGMSSPTWQDHNRETPKLPGTWSVQWIPYPPDVRARLVTDFRGCPTYSFVPDQLKLDGVGPVDNRPSTD